MASRRVLVMAIFVASIVTSTLGANFMVDWKYGVDYSAWSQAQDFHVGDTLMFMYHPGVHNVVQVNETEFTQCSASSEAVPFTTGSDVIELTAPGETRYICTIGYHCSYYGMKLLINVSSGAGTPLPGLRSSSSSGPLKSYVSMIAVIAAYFMI